MYKGKNILVIHPYDPSTNFLCAIYKDINATVIRDTISKSKLKKLMVDADRIIMLGHGTRAGLCKLDQFGMLRSLVDSSLAYILRENKDNIYIWCHADEFVKRYDLKGFSTGMFISETSESKLFKINSTVDEIKHSNELFAQTVRSVINKDSPKIKAAVNELYKPDSDVIKYNAERMYSFE
jgi:hypothetical protein